MGKEASAMVARRSTSHRDWRRWWWWLLPLACCFVCWVASSAATVAPAAGVAVTSLPGFDGPLPFSLETGYVYCIQCAHDCCSDRDMPLLFFLIDSRYAEIRVTGLKSINTPIRRVYISIGRDQTEIGLAIALSRDARPCQKKQPRAPTKRGKRATHGSRFAWYSWHGPGQDRALRASFPLQPIKSGQPATSIHTQPPW